MAADNRRQAQAQRRENGAQSEDQEDEASMGMFNSLCFSLSTDIFAQVLVITRLALQQAGVRSTDLHPPVANPSHCILGPRRRVIAPRYPFCISHCTSSLSKLYHGSLPVAVVSLLHPNISNFGPLILYGISFVWYYFCMVS
jgi:hypothetical protein